MVGLTEIIVLLMFSTSLWAWIQLYSAQSWSSFFGSPEHASVTDQRLWPQPPLAILITLLMILMQIQVVAADLLEMLHVLPPASHEFVMNQRALLISNSYSLALLAMLLAFIKFIPGRFAKFKEYGITTQHIRSQTRWGILGFLLSILAVIAARLITLPFISEDQVHPLIDLAINAPTPWLWIQIIVAAVLLAPLLEELMYRVILQSWLTRWLSPVSAMVVTAVVFSTVHGFPQALALFPLALILGFIYFRFRSYLACVLTHFCFNALNLLLAFVSPQDLTGV